MAEQPILIEPIVQQHVVEQPAAVLVQHDQARLATQEQVQAIDHLFAKHQQIFDNADQIVPDRGFNAGRAIPFNPP